MMDSGSTTFELWRQRLRILRFRRLDQTSIRTHRALYQLRLNRSEILIAFLLPVAFNLLLLLSLDDVILLWRRILEFWVPRLDFNAGVKMQAFDVGLYDLWIPTVSAVGVLPTAATWWVTAITCVAIFLATYLIPKNAGLPMVYILRALVFIQTTALAYFAFIPATFPYALGEYVGNNLFMGVILIAAIPWLLGITYYLFDFSLFQKITLTALMIGFFLIATPMQYLLHVNVAARFSLLFMPICYLVLGLFMDMMALVALYSYGMSWRFKRF